MASQQRLRSAPTNVQLFRLTVRRPESRLEEMGLVAGAENHAADGGIK